MIYLINIIDFCKYQLVLNLMPATHLESFGTEAIKSLGKLRNANTIWDEALPSRQNIMLTFLPTTEMSKFDNAEGYVPYCHLYKTCPVIFITCLSSDVARFVHAGVVTNNKAVKRTTAFQVWVAAFVSVTPLDTFEECWGALQLHLWQPKNDVFLAITKWILCQKLSRV